MIEQLQAYDKKYRCGVGKGHLCVLLVITRRARDLDFPLHPDSLLTSSGGQVLGLGVAPVQAILKDYGIDRVLAKEGGRTSRGSIDNMRRYADFLNELFAQGVLDLLEIERYWIGRVRDFFAGKPFKLKLDSSKSLRAALRDVLEQAVKRQKELTGTMYAGAMMQHLVGAHLELAFPGQTITHHGFSVADGPSARPGDFLIGQTAIHVTTAPGEMLIRKCRDNLQDGMRPLIITGARQVNVAETLAENLGVGGRVDVFEIEQFLASAIFERSAFSAKLQRGALEEIVARYNSIIDAHETDPSLKIVLGR